jgi:predicted DNA-binding transcriptional regulator YafY
VLALLEILQSGGIRTVGELSRRLGVDERTVRRYVSHLVDLQIPVRSVRGRHGGYRLASGFRLPPLMFTDDEAVAVLLGLVAVRRTAPTVTPAEPTESAAAKLRRVLPEALGHRLDALLDAADFTAQPSQTDPGGDAPAGILLLLAEAAGARRPVAIDYTDRHGRHTERIVHPYGLVVHAGRWYLVAADPIDTQVRSFRLDRIAAPALRQGSFEMPAEFDAGAHVVTGLARTAWQHEVSVRVQASADEVRRRLPSGVAIVDTSTEPGWVQVRLRAQRLDWVPALLAGLGHPFLVEQPAALRDEVRSLARRLDDYAGQPPNARSSDSRLP